MIMVFVTMHAFDRQS